MEAQDEILKLECLRAAKEIYMQDHNVNIIGVATEMFNFIKSKEDCKCQK